MSSAPDGTRTDELDLIGLVYRFWRQKWIGLAFVFASLCAGLFYLNITERIYTAQLLVSPVDQSANRMPQGLSSLSSLVGVDISGQSSVFSMYSDAIKSYSVAKQLSMDPRIMHWIYRNSWDARAKRWQQPVSQSGSITSVIKALIGWQTRPWHPPDAKDLKLFIDGSVQISEDKRKQSLTVSFSDADPEFAAYFVGRVNGAADTVLRQRAIKRADAYIDYIKRRLANVEVYSYRLSLFELLASYEKTKMLASSDISYAGEAFSDVWVSPVPTSPKPLIVIAISLLAGLVAWVAYVLLLLPAIAAVRRHSRVPVGGE